MAKTRELVRRRKAITNIRKITRTMELIATSRFTKAMDRASEAAAYTRNIAQLPADLSASAGDVTHPLLEERAEVKNTQLLILCSNLFFLIIRNPPRFTLFPYTTLFR